MEKDWFTGQSPTWLAYSGLSIYIGYNTTGVTSLPRVLSPCGRLGSFSGWHWWATLIHYCALAAVPNEVWDTIHNLVTDEVLYVHSNKPMLINKFKHHNAIRGVTWHHHALWNVKRHRYSMWSINRHQYVIWNLNCKLWLASRSGITRLPDIKKIVFISA